MNDRNPSWAIRYEKQKSKQEGLAEGEGKASKRVDHLRKALIEGTPEYYEELEKKYNDLMQSELEPNLSLKQTSSDYTNEDWIEVDIVFPEARFRNGWVMDEMFRDALKTIYRDKIIGTMIASVDEYIERILEEGSK